jgi:uncharacterized protein (DUF2147 family)
LEIEDLFTLKSASIRPSAEKTDAEGCISGAFDGIFTFTFASVIFAPFRISWRKEMIRTLVLAGALALVAGLAQAEEPIVGNWKTVAGDTAAIGPCGGGYCITLKSGKYAGKKIGTLAGTGGSYSGEITDPADDKIYSGSGSVSGRSLKLKGCVLNVLCKSQTWTRL